jgi:mannose-6-phosphate isomerase-like protein (cupin superfamily)
MNATPQYNITTDVKYAPLEAFDVDAIHRALAGGWTNQTLVTINDSVVRLGVIHGEFHWHKHDGEDEFFFVVQGKLFVDIQGGETFELQPHQGVSVPKGVVHRTRAPEPTSILMVASRGVVPTGD